MRHRGVSEPIADRVREEIKRLDISKRAVARKAGMSTTTLYNKLACRSDFTVVELHRIALALRVPTASLTPDDLDDEAGVA